MIIFQKIQYTLCAIHWPKNKLGFPHLCCLLLNIQNTLIPIVQLNQCQALEK